MKSAIVLLLCSFILTLLSCSTMSARYAKWKTKCFFEIRHYFVFSFIAENCFKLLHAARGMHLHCMLLSCILRDQEQIRPVRLGGAISVIFGRQVWSRVHYCKRDEVYFTILLWQSNGLQDGLISRMLFCKLYKIMVKKVTFVGFRMGNRPPLDPPLCRCVHLSLITCILNLA